MWLERNRRLYEERGYGFWPIESVQVRTSSATAASAPLDLDGRSETEIDWHVRKAERNRGIATEAARAARDRGIRRSSG